MHLVFLLPWLVMCIGTDMNIGSLIPITSGKPRVVTREARASTCCSPTRRRRRTSRPCPAPSTRWRATSVCPPRTGYSMMRSLAARIGRVATASLVVMRAGRPMLRRDNSGLTPARSVSGGISTPHCSTAHGHRRRTGPDRRPTGLGRGARDLSSSIGGG